MGQPDPTAARPLAPGAHGPAQGNQGTQTSQAKTAEKTATQATRTTIASTAAATATWLTAGAAVAWLDGRVDLGSQALPLVLAAAASGLWLSAGAAASLSLLATLAFNWLFIPPRGSFNVDTPAHLLLLATMLAVGAGTALLVARQRGLTAAEAAHRQRWHQLQALSEALRNAETTAQALQALADALVQALATEQPQATAASVVLLAPTDTAPSAAQAAPAVAGPQPTNANPANPAEPADPVIAPDPLALGQANADELAGLLACRQQGQAFGPGTGRYERPGAWYLPLRGRHSHPGAALLRLPPEPAWAEGPRRLTLRLHAQALCDQAGQAIERAQALAQAAQQAQQAQDQRLRTTLLAAISHDYRTPLATIMGAASSLDEQGERLQPAQRQRLARSIVDEARQLARLTDNALQLARLDSRMQPHLDWESPEELVGSVLQRVRQRHPQRAIRTRLAPGLPLLHCDAVLLAQLLDNLLDNALRYSPPEAPVELLLRVQASELLLAVRDRGPGVPPGQRERVFALFERAAGPGAARGTGVGLAVCRAIAQAHGGRLVLRPRAHGGSAFECWLPLGRPPELPADDIPPCPPTPR